MRVGGHQAGERVVEGATGPRRRFGVVAAVVADGYPVEVACRVLEVSVSGYYCWRRRPPSARSVRHAMLLDVIAEIHQASRRTYGAGRIHAELVHGRGLQVARWAAELVTRRNGLAGLPGRSRWRKVPQPAHRHRPRRSAAPPRRARPAVGHRHHRAPHPGTQDLLRGRVGCVQPPRGGMIHRLPPPGGSSHQRAGWPSTTANPTGRQSIPITTRKPDSTGRRNTVLNLPGIHARRRVHWQDSTTLMSCSFRMRTHETISGIVAPSSTPLLSAISPPG